MVKLNVPETLGVPETAPPADIVIPAGKLPSVTAKVVGAVALPADNQLL